MEIKIYDFQKHGDERGQLISIEQADVPFKIKRIYYMYDTKEGIRRGYHAHKELQQILICVHGSCKILLDDGIEKEVIELNKPYKGLYISNTVWREMYDFSPDAVLMVIASEEYDEKDYIRNYESFLNYIDMNKKKEGYDGKNI